MYPLGESAVALENITGHSNVLKIIEPKNKLLAFLDKSLDRSKEIAQNFSMPFIDRKLANFEAGKLLGGQPFKMRTNLTTRTVFNTDGTPLYE